MAQQYNSGDFDAYFDNIAVGELRQCDLWISGLKSLNTLTTCDLGAIPRPCACGGLQNVFQTTLS